MTQAIAKMLLVIGADEVMIPMCPHSGGNKKRSPNSQCDRAPNS